MRVNIANELLLWFPGVIGGDTCTWLVVCNSLGREFFKAAPVPVYSPVPFVQVPPGPVHFAVLFGTFECRSL